MSDRPNAPTLLRGVARLLAADVRPALDDRGLSFRVLVAGHLLESVAAELDHAEALELGELDHLASVLGREVPGGLAGAERAALLAELRGELARGLRDGRFDALGDLRAGLMRGLAATIALRNPRFDLSDHGGERPGER